jgi:energy-coupling factor transporter transmembrane protein EcfT
VPRTPSAARCCAFALAGALYRHPLILAGALGGIVVAGVAAGVGREVARSLKLALPFALLVAIVNALVYEGGETLLIRGGEFLGRRWDVTLESAAEGMLMGNRRRRATKPGHHRSTRMETPV